MFIKVLIILENNIEAKKLNSIIASLKEDTRFHCILYLTNIENEKQSSIDIANKIFYETDKIIKNENPNVVLVFNSSTTALNSTFASFYNKIIIINIKENDICLSFKEKLNCSIIDDLSTITFDLIKDNKMICENIFNLKNIILDTVLI